MSEDLNKTLSEIEQAIREYSFLANHYNNTAKSIEKQITLLELRKVGIEQMVQQQSTQEESVNE